MVQLDEARFLSELTKLFQATRDAGSLTITHKRLQQRPKRGQARTKDRHKSRTACG